MTPSSTSTSTTSPAAATAGADTAASTATTSASTSASTSTSTSTSTQRVPLWRAAHGRTGDKGDRSNISVIAWHADLYPLLVEQITEEAVARRFAHRRPSKVTRYVLPRLGAMNFVLDGVLDGGVNDSLNLDSHGKALAFLLLELPLEVPAELVPLLRGPAA